MARDINQVTMTGRVVAPGIELRWTKGDNPKPVADFKLVSNHKQLPQDHPDRLKFAVFVKVTLWGDNALHWSGQDEHEILPLGKGDEVLVSGALFSDDFTPNGSDTRTSGRVRIDHAEIKLLKRARSRTEDNEY